MTSKRKPRRRSLSPAKLDEMIEEATVDACGESEQAVGFFTLLEERLKLPFKTEVLGVEVIFERLDMTDDQQIVAVCSTRQIAAARFDPGFNFARPSARRCGMDRSVSPLGAGQMTMAGKPIQIDRDKLRAEVTFSSCWTTPSNFCRRPSFSRSRRSTSI